MVCVTNRSPDIPATAATLQTLQLTTNERQQIVQNVNRMKKALILAYYFPPVAASGSTRPAGIARHLSEHGYLPHVVMADPESVYPETGQDRALLEGVRDDLKVHRVRYRSTLKDLLSLRDALLRRNAGPGASEPESSAATAPATPSDEVSFKDYWLDRLFLLPDHQKYWVKPAVEYVCSLPEQDRPDVILATANPWSSLLAGMKIAQRLNIPWVADFRDPWARNPKPQPNARLLPQIRTLEAKVVNSATRVIANTEPLAAALREDYRDRANVISAVTNGYLQNLMSTVERRPVAGKLEFCHFGSVYPLRNPVVLLRALDRLTAAKPEIARKITLRFIGGWDVQDSECDALAEKLEAIGALSREESVPRDVALQMMADAPYLLILQQDFPLQIPAKLYEYIAVGRPMLVVGGQGATADLVKQFGLGICCENDEAALLTLLEDLASNRRTIEAPAADVIARFSYSEIAGQVAAVLDRAIADHTR